MPGTRNAYATLRALLACGLLSACGPGDAGTTSPAPPVAEAHPAPGVPVVPDGSERPVPVAVVPEVEAVAPTEAALTPEIHAAFVRGTTLAQAQSLTSIVPELVGGDGRGTEIYRWTDSGGTSFTARFDGGALTTKSRLGVQRGPGTPSPNVPGVDVDTMSVAQIAPGVYIPLQRAVNSATEQPLGASEIPAAPEVPVAPVASPSAPPVPATAGPTIVIAGAARRAREGSGKASSYRPRAALPAFSRSLEEGSFEVRFLNPSESAVSAGLRQEKLGKDVPVPPKGKASIKVNRGVYQVFFLRESEPNTLFEAQSITIDGFQATDVEVHLDPENVEVRLIDYSKPGN